VDGLQSLTWAGGQVIYKRLGVRRDLVGWGGCMHEFLLFWGWVGKKVFFSGIFSNMERRDALVGVGD
jgi:hypothetical protein